MSSSGYFSRPCPKPLLQSIDHRDLVQAGVRLSVLRLDLFCPDLSGNKYFKLKHNIGDAIDQGYRKILSFGGAFSNHIHALALAGQHAGIDTVGVIRGEASAQHNPTLADARRAGMQLRFVKRVEYRRRYEADYIASLLAQFGPAYLVPEGGSNALAVKGCTEIVDLIDSEVGEDYHTIVLPCATGATLAGVIAGAASKKQVLGVAVLKAADFIADEVREFLKPYGNQCCQQWVVEQRFHCGGYAKLNADLIAFIDQFTLITGIALEPIYSGKCFYGLFQMIAAGEFSRGDHIVAVHTGGMQGLRGMTAAIEQLRRIAPQ